MLRLVVDARIGVGGVGRYERDLIAGLERLSNPPAMTVVCRSGRSITSSPFGPWRGRAVTKAVSASGADVVHGLHLTVPRLDIPTVVTIHDAIPLEHPASMPNPLSRAWFLRLLRKGAERATAIIVPSELTRAAVQRATGRDASIHVIPLGVSPAFTPLSTEERTAARALFGRGGPYIATMTTAKAHKNASLVSAVAGRLQLPVACRTDIEDVGAASRVAHLSDDELRSFYGGAEVFLLPSLLEGFGLPIVEALASGTPVVCARSIGAVEFVERGVVPVDTSSVEPIIEAVSEMARDDGLRERLVRDGGEQARSLTIPLMCERTMDVYREAAGSK